MNLLRDSLASLSHRFRLRIWSSILFYAGYVILGYVDMRIALGVFLVLFAYAMESKMEGGVR